MALLTLQPLLLTICSVILCPSLSDHRTSWPSPLRRCPPCCETLICKSACLSFFSNNLVKHEIQFLPISFPLFSIWSKWTSYLIIFAEGLNDCFLVLVLVIKWWFCKIRERPSKSLFCSFVARVVLLAWLLCHNRMLDKHRNAEEDNSGSKSRGSRRVPRARNSHWNLPYYPLSSD